MEKIGEVKKFQRAILLYPEIGRFHVKKLYVVYDFPFIYIISVVTSVSFQVFNLKPFTVKDLQTRSLPDRIRDLHDLVYLYPNLPKDYVFEKYYSSKDALLTTNVDGYVKTDLITDIPLMGERLRISQEGPVGVSGGNAVDNAALDDILDMLMSPERDFEFDMGMDFATPNCT